MGIHSESKEGLKTINTDKTREDEEATAQDARVPESLKEN
jgi:hypothetical protein